MNGKQLFQILGIPVPNGESIRRTSDHDLVRHVPKGLHRYRSHVDADAVQDAWLDAAIARLSLSGLIAFTAIRFLRHVGLVKPPPVPSARLRSRHPCGP